MRPAMKIGAPIKIKLCTIRQKKYALRFQYKSRSLHYGVLIFYNWISKMFNTLEELLQYVMRVRIFLEAN